MGVIPIPIPVPAKAGTHLPTPPHVILNAAKRSEESRCRSNPSLVSSPVGAVREPPAPSTHHEPTCLSHVVTTLVVACPSSPFPNVPLCHSERSEAQ